jgi:hypothetical protein
VTAEDCDALDDPCNEGACVNSACILAPRTNGLPCDDGLFCTIADACSDGVCTGAARPCPTMDPCEVGLCDPTTDECTVVAGNDGDPCTDGDLCTLSSYCQGGVCQPGQSVDCSFLGGTCGDASCDPAVGCVAAPKNDGEPCTSDLIGQCQYGQCADGKCEALPVADGTTCNDFMFNPCSEGKCQAGQCVSTPKDEGALCDDFQFNPCTEGHCQAGICASLPKAEGQACEDGYLCTVETTCQSGICTGGSPNDCAPPGGCFVGTCDVFLDQCVAAPGNDGGACDAGDPCLTGTSCSGGACTNGAPANDGGACDDGLSCTSGEVCGGGLCGGGSGAIVYFSEDFSDNAAGWTLDEEWQIGTALASSGGVFGSDPASDHSPTGDNGVAGVVIGGNALASLHPYRYLTSPPFDASAGGGTVKFAFYRWLNSDYDPFMHNSVDVWDGAQWVNLWTSGGAPGVQDSPPVGAGWTYVEHDVTAYASAAMQVRFGFDINANGVFTIGSWNVDDVRVTSVTCP